MGALTRLRQVWSACTAQISVSDRHFVAVWLTEAEQERFYALDIPHQYHSLRVAYTALEMQKNEQIACDKRLLVKCALLHDTAKRAGTVSTFDKIVCVLLDKAIPRHARRLACSRRGSRLQNLRYAIYLYYNHAQLAADELGGQLGMIIGRHHDKYKKGEPPELTFLRRADDLN